VLDVSERYLTALRSSHGAIFRVDAHLGDDLVAYDVPITGGSVTVDGGSDVRRSLSLDVADAGVIPGLTGIGTVSPYGTTLHAYRGVRYVDGTVEWVQLGVFRVASVTATAAGAVSVSATDLGKAVADARFLAPAKSVTTNTIPVEIARLLAAVNPAWVLTNNSASTASTPTLLWERERWTAINELATSIGCEVFFGADGLPVLQPMPAITNPVSWWADAGEAGVLVEAEAQTNRERTYNAVVAFGERTDGVLPVTSTVYDLVPGSPTLWNGPYGQVPYFYSSPVLTTMARATAAATSILGRTRGLFRQLRLSCVPNAALDAGDVIMVRWPSGLSERHVVDKLSIPLTAKASMSIDTRSTAPDLP
jgi:hypothetical protein